MTQDSHPRRHGSHWLISNLLLLVEGLLSFTSPLDIVNLGVHTLVLLSGTDQNIGQRAFHDR